ncbi:Cyanophycin synthetase [uncultured Clostridium sp.]|uniref:cyanophycin synthetase n=1 Tax=uncultured Clostridium sp. TaxID=59620 RepID=UPI0008221385|nr:cyanophycin synthetase [uncultured Clostridium sp.]SCK01520.1 Cyanophycin synthetase [uncultured Clostridium sp.]
MKILSSNIYEGKNIYSHKKCIRLDVDLEGYCETPSNEIEGFNDELVKMIPELYTHRCGIDEDGGFVKRLKEGTYLAHICEHIIIAIQNIIGIEVAYGKAREVEGDIYQIIYQYQYPKAGIECAKLAIDIINGLINGIVIDFKSRVSIIKEMLNEELIGPSTLAVCEAAKKQGLPVMKLGSSNFYQIGYGKQGRVIEASITSNTSCIAADISCDKLLTKELLDLQNLPVARGAKVYNVISLLKEADRIGYPLVLKPQYGNKGRGVILGIKNEKELITAYQKLINEFNDIILEEYHKGDDYRVCVVNNKVVGVSLRVPPYIIGDGNKSVEELIDELNSHEYRGEGHEKPLTKVKKDVMLNSFISEQGYTLNSILENDKKLLLRKNANLSTGGIAIDYTDKICEENKDICIRAAKAIGIDVCGVDICTNDISKSIINNGIIMEVNTAPGLRMHIYPSEGKSRDVGNEIINMMYKDGIKNIPVVSISGTNGKTTTTRLINYTLCKLGMCSGMTSTEGIFINNQCIDIGDDTGMDSAKCVLLNKDVEIAVLETARGGIIRRGLAYDLADVAVITNITEDHLGCDGVKDMEDLCYVKSLIAEAVKTDGYAVINADDKYSKTIIDRIKANIIYFSKEYKNPLIINSIREGKTVVYLKEDYICINKKRKEYKLSNIDDIPIILNGALKFNIENVMAACAALVGLNINYNHIKNSIESFELNSKENYGRFNIHDYNGVRIILDYGHNIEGYKKALTAVKEITNGKIIGVIGVPGDRSNDSIKEIGKISSKFIDRIIIKEDKDRRGRKQGETAELIKQGIDSNKENNSTKIVLNEVEALMEAIKEANVGDSIIVFYEKIEPLIEVIDKLNDNKINTDIIKSI